MTASCSQTKKQENDIPFFTEDIFFHILLCLPAEFLHYCGRYVCKAWAKIICEPYFVKAHLLQSKGGLFIQKFGRPYHSRFLEFKEREFTMTHINGYFPGIMVSSCCGLSLFCVANPQRIIYVGNHVTMKYKRLPFPIVADELFPSCHLAFISRTGEYKVVCHCVNLSGVHRWLVLSVGNNMSWRKLETSLKGNYLDYGDRTSVSVGGVIYWSQWNNRIFAVDLDDETFHPIEVPNEFIKSFYWLLELGNNLSCVVNHETEVHVFILKDLRRNEWAQLYKISEAIGQHFLCETFVAVGWLDDGRILVFNIGKMGVWMQNFVVAYNVKTGETKTFSDFNLDVIQKHTNSLVSW